MMTCSSTGPSRFESKRAIDSGPTRRRAPQPRGTRDVVNIKSADTDDFRRSCLRELINIYATPGSTLSLRTNGAWQSPSLAMSSTLCDVDASALSPRTARPTKLEIPCAPEGDQLRHGTLRRGVDGLEAGAIVRNNRREEPGGWRGGPTAEPGQTPGLQRLLCELLVSQRGLSRQR